MNINMFKIFELVTCEVRMNKIVYMKKRGVK
jgi:hypothetical protein